MLHKIILVTVNVSIYCLQALVLLRNRNQLTPNVVLPLFFRMFRCQDKQLRQLLFRHIVSGGFTAAAVLSRCLWWVCCYFSLFLSWHSRYTCTTRASKVRGKSTGHKMVIKTCSRFSVDWGKAQPACSGLFDCTALQAYLCLAFPALPNPLQI